jgi:NTP pyrophosphatase (non-canonical NTP hydrolase)
MAKNVAAITTYTMEQAQEECNTMAWGMHLESAAARIDTLTHLCHTASASRGWWTDLETGKPKPRNVGELLMLTVSEVGEAMEGHRKGAMSDKIPKFTAVEEELADTLVRIFDLAHVVAPRLGEAFVAKFKYNRVRKDHSIEARKAEGGKAY